MRTKLRKRSCCSIKALTAGSRSGRSVIATLDTVDLDGDVISNGAVGEQDAVLLPAHDWMSVPLGRAVVKESGGELIAEFSFNETPEGREWFSAVKFDYDLGSPLQQWSFSYEAEVQHPEIRDGRRVNVIDKLKVIEVSPVLVGAGVNTRTSCIGDDCKARKSALSPELRQLEEEVEASLAKVVALKTKEVIEKTKARLLYLESIEAISRVKQVTDEFYLEVAPDKIPQQKRTFVTLVVSDLAKSWQIPQPTVKWFTEETAEERRVRLENGEPIGNGFSAHKPAIGMAEKDRGVIWISADLDGKLLQDVAVHETLHIRFPTFSEQSIHYLEQQISN